MVYERGGITPDSVVNDTDEGPMVRELVRRGLFFKFANVYMKDHKASQFASVDARILDEFRTFLAGERFDFAEDSEAKVKDLRKLAEQSHYSRDVLADLDVMASAITREKQRAFDRYGDHITAELNQELASRYRGEKGRIEASLHVDPQLAAGVALLRDRVVYQQKLED
jgi:carboxyl-terminal processing protease